MTWHHHLCICSYFWNLKVQTVDSSLVLALCLCKIKQSLLKSQKWKWNQWYLRCIVHRESLIWNQWHIWHPSINYLSQVPRWVLAQQEMPYPAYYRSDLELNLMIIMMSPISRQWPCDFFFRNDKGRGVHLVRKENIWGKKCFSNFSAMSFQR